MFEYLNYSAQQWYQHYRFRLNFSEEQEKLLDQLTKACIRVNNENGVAEIAEAVFYVLYGPPISRLALDRYNQVLSKKGE